MKKRVILFVAIMLIFAFIPICSNAITTDEAYIDRLLSAYDYIKNILIVIIAIDSLISIVVLIKKKSNKRQYVKYLIILFEITLLIYFIAVRCIYDVFGEMITYFKLTVLLGLGYVCILLSFVSIVIQIITIKCDSNIKKRVFKIFTILSIITLVGIIISGIFLINRVKSEDEEWKTLRQKYQIIGMQTKY